MKSYAKCVEFAFHGMTVAAIFDFRFAIFDLKNAAVSFFVKTYNR